jgi:hypothetical protein
VKLDYLRTLGVDHPINYRREDRAKLRCAAYAATPASSTSSSTRSAAQQRTAPASPRRGSNCSPLASPSVEAGSLQFVRDIRFSAFLRFPVHPDPAAG